MKKTIDEIRKELERGGVSIDLIDRICALVITKSETRQKVILLRMREYDYRTIGEMLNISFQVAHKHIKKSEDLKSMIKEYCEENYPLDGYYKVNSFENRAKWKDYK